MERLIDVNQYRLAGNRNLALEPDTEARPTAMAAATEPVSSGEMVVEEITFQTIIGALWRRKVVIAAIVVMFVAIAVVYVLKVTPRYSAEASILVDTRGTRVVNIEEVVPTLVADDALMQTQSEFLFSEAIVGKVVERLDLVQDPEFNTTLRPKKLISRSTLRPGNLIKMVAGGRKPEESGSDPADGP